MQDGNAILDLLKTNIQAAMPTRLVTRSATDFQNRSAADRRGGVVTLVSLTVNDLKAPRAIEDHAGKLRIGVTAEFELAETADGEAVETAEWALWEEIKAFALAPGLGLCPLDALNLVFSGQASAPQGWVFVLFEFGELEY